ncbi:unnamed protein product [Durusdinium trenchii]|uniref:Uncharacterized protein n=1 Tax=Durusdinium trenchii TaxID=1381693 RepID=A0ABP0LCK2_9DINO
MLAADKLELTSLIKKNATALKGKELELNQSNFEAVGTQAAVLAGFAVCMLAKIDVPDSINPVLMALYYAFAVVNLMGNLACVSVVASVNILGTSLGLRGPDGSMRQAADGMHQQPLGTGRSRQRKAVQPGWSRAILSLRCWIGRV